MIAYFDCFSGISGDMALGALLDAGAPLSLDEVVEALGLGDEVRLEIGREERGHLGGTRVLVKTGPGPTRTLPQLRAVVEDAGLPGAVRARTLDALGRLGEAEGAIHGLPPDQLHLHELGGADTLVDLVGTFWLLESLGVGTVFASPLPASRGWIGELPLPAPASLRVLAGTGAILEPSESTAELVTPTGAAILAAAPARFERPSLRLEAVGYGIGGRPTVGNALAVQLGHLAEAGTEVAVLEINLDDMPPTLIAALVEDLIAEGALDVTVAPVVMKKGRPGHQLNVIVEPADARRLGRRLLEHSTTLGVRMGRKTRLLADRRLIEVDTGLGSVGVKLKELEGSVLSVTPEYEDCRALSRSSGRGLAEITRIATEVAWREVKQ